MLVVHGGRGLVARNSMRFAGWLFRLELTTIAIGKGLAKKKWNGTSSIPS